MNADFQHVIQAKCAVEQVLREWPSPTEYKLSDTDDALSKQNAALSARVAELVVLMNWINNHGGLGYAIHGALQEAIAKHGAPR